MQSSIARNNAQHDALRVRVLALTSYTPVFGIFPTVWRQTSKKQQHKIE